MGGVVFIVESLSSAETGPKEKRGALSAFAFAADLGGAAEQ